MSNRPEALGDRGEADQDRGQISSPWPPTCFQACSSTPGPAHARLPAPSPTTPHTTRNRKSQFQGPLRARLAT